jgi:rhodanese-related sulfurtransferase
MAARPGTLILDARSESAFAAGHISGAVNLPLTDFTAQSLARTIGRSDRPILIYCNNNFSNDRAPVMLKSIQLALNIQTFINLYGYGYRNVRELNAVIDFNDPAVHWTGAGTRLAANLSAR